MILAMAKKQGWYKWHQPHGVRITKPLRTTISPVQVSDNHGQLFQPCWTAWCLADTCLGGLSNSSTLQMWYLRLGTSGLFNYNIICALGNNSLLCSHYLGCRARLASLTAAETRTAFLSLCVCGWMENQSSNSKFPNEFSSLEMQNIDLVSRHFWKWFLISWLARL